MDFRKYTILIFILFSTSIMFAQNYWLSSYTPTNTNLKSVMFLDSLNGWACGDSGIIIHTSNGGQNWEIQNTKSKAYLHNIFFLNKRLGWALGWNIYNPQPPYGTYYLKTTDGGVNWDTSFFPIEDVYLMKVFFQDSLYGFLGGSYKNLLRTIDGGAHWLDVQIDSLMIMNFPVTNFSFYNQDYGYAVGGVMDIAGVIWRTTNRGIRWTPYIVASEPLMDMVFFDSSRILGFGGDFEYGPSIITTTNSGANWKYTSLEMFGHPSVLTFRDLKDGWGSLGWQRVLIFTQDSGKSFVQINTPDSAVINDIVFPDTKHGFAVGEFGKILKFNSATIGIGNQNTIVSKNFELNQNYPNPFNPFTTISYELGSNSYVVLKIFDITGREIRTLHNGYQSRGKYNLKFGSDFLTSGVYLYQIVVRDLTGKSNDFFTQTKKMLLIK
jgi:photosystem II stability/assembly factor-like uncharacterized protein